MTRKCPTCGRPLPGKRLLSRDELLEFLHSGEDVYRGNLTNRWFVTHGHGEVAYETVRALVDDGSIVSAYSDCPHDMYRVGRTIDIPRTLARCRRLGRKKAGTVYVGDPPDVA